MLKFKWSYILVAYLLASINYNSLAQSSNCGSNLPMSSEFQASYLNVSKILSARNPWLLQSSDTLNPYYDTVLQRKILNELNLIYSSHLPQTDSLFKRYCINIHQFFNGTTHFVNTVDNFDLIDEKAYYMKTPTVLPSILIITDSVPWLNNWKNGNYLTTNPQLNTILAKFKLRPCTYNRLDQIFPNSPHSFTLELISECSNNGDYSMDTIYNTEEIVQQIQALQIPQFAYVKTNDQWIRNDTVKNISRVVDPTGSINYYFTYFFIFNEGSWIHNTLWHIKIDQNCNVQFVDRIYEYKGFGQPGSSLPFHSERCLLTFTADVEESYKETYLYPNPTTGIVYLQDYDATNEKINVYDCIGKTINFNLDAETSSINLQGMPNGIYFIQRSNKTKSRTYSVIKY